LRCRRGVILDPVLLEQVHARLPLFVSPRSIMRRERSVRCFRGYPPGKYGDAPTRHRIVGDDCSNFSGEEAAMSVVTVEQRGPVSVIAINRPEKLNAINKAVAIELQEAFAAFDGSD